MKARCFFTTLFSILLLATFGYQVNGQSFSVQSKKISRSVLNQTLPFSEDWESLSFTTHNWSKSGNEWIIDSDNGNSGASVKFDGSDGLVNYTSYLTSDLMDSVKIGDIFIVFDVMLADINSTGTEWFYVEVFDGSEWTKIDSLSNNGSFSWVNKKYDITRLVKLKTF